jgi:hypothetical protein
MDEDDGVEGSDAGGTGSGRDKSMCSSLLLEPPSNFLEMVSMSKMIKMALGFGVPREMEAEQEQL